MKDLRQDKEPMFEVDFSTKKLSKYYKYVFIAAFVFAMVWKPSQIATVIGMWITSFFGTLVNMIEIDGISSINFIILIAGFCFVGYFLNKFIKSRNNKESVSKRAGMLK